MDSCKRIGAREGDTIIGGHAGGAVIAALVARKSRYLAKAANKTTAAVLGGIIILGNEGLMKILMAS